MFARVTLAEIDTVRTSVDDAVERFRGVRRFPRCRAARATRAAYVLPTPEGKALVMTFWRDDEAAAAGVVDSGPLRRAGPEVRRRVLPLAARPRVLRGLARRRAGASVG